MTKPGNVARYADLSMSVLMSLLNNPTGGSIMSDLLVNGTIVLFGRHWSDADESVVTDHQRATVARWSGRVRLLSSLASWCAVTVDQPDGSVDVHTIGPGRLDGSHYTCTVLSDGRKIEKQIIWAAGVPY